MFERESGRYNSVGNFGSVAMGIDIYIMKKIFNSC